MNDSNVTVVTPSVTVSVMNLTESRVQLVKGLGKIGVLIQAYALALSQAFDLVDNTGKVSTPWFDLTGKLKAGVKAERANFVNDMTTAGYSEGTIKVNWQRVKEASGYVTAGNRVKGSTDVDTKTATELKTIINRILKSEEDGEECHASTIVEALKAQYVILTGEAYNASK